MYLLDGLPLALDKMSNRSYLLITSLTYMCLRFLIKWPLPDLTFLALFKSIPDLEYHSCVAAIPLPHPFSIPPNKWRQEN